MLLANMKNMALLSRHLEKQAQPERGDHYY